MARPPEYERLSDFTDYAVNNPSAPYNPSDHDAELDALLLSVNQTISFLNGITRSDGKLLNGSVTVDTLSHSLYAFLTNIRQPTQYAGVWVAGKDFVFADIVFDGIQTYFCISPHTSADLATDVALSRWIPIGLRAGGAGGAATLDGDELVPLVQIPVLTNEKLPVIALDRLPSLPYAKLERLAKQTTVDFGVNPINSMTFTVEDASATTSSIIMAMVASKVGDRIGDELECDPIETSARCLVDGKIQINLTANMMFVAGQYVINYSIF